MKRADWLDRDALNLIDPRRTTLRRGVALSVGCAWASVCLLLGIYIGAAQLWLCWEFGRWLTGGRP